MGLNVPRVTQVFLQLKKLGADVDSSVFTVEQGAQQLLSMLKGGGRDA